MRKMEELTLEKLEALAQNLAERAVPSQVFRLWGDLGSGKTTFTRAFIREYCQNKVLDVPSPTFTLVQIYDAPRGSVWHADLYRLKTKEELEELGLIEALYSQICLIEWPEILADLELPNAWDLRFQVASEKTRTIEICPPKDTIFD